MVARAVPAAVVEAGSANVERGGTTPAVRAVRVFRELATEAAGNRVHAVGSARGVVGPAGDGPAPWTDRGSNMRPQKHSGSYELTSALAPFERVALILALMAWTGFFLAGLFVPTQGYRDRLTEGALPLDQALQHMAVIALCYTITNVPILCCLAALLGALRPADTARGVSGGRRAQGYGEPVRLRDPAGLRRLPDRGFGCDHVHHESRHRLLAVDAGPIPAFGPAPVRPRFPGRLQPGVFTSLLNSVERSAGQGEGESRRGACWCPQLPRMARPPSRRKSSLRSPERTAPTAPTQARLSCELSDWDGARAAQSLGEVLGSR